MRTFCILLAICAATAVGVPRNQSKIVGGSLAVIGQYPYATALLYSSDLVTFYQACGGTILSSSAILTAAHCVAGDTTNRWKARVGSSFASSGGTVHELSRITYHFGFNSMTMDNDISVLRTAKTIDYINNAVGAASIAGPSYNLKDNQIVWAIGWGTTSSGGSQSEQLRHVQIWSVNQETCRTRYAELGYSITDNMLCSGWLDVGGRDQCQGDDGGPLIHNNIIIGIGSWGQQCAHSRFPGVNTRVSSYTSWIENAAGCCNII